MPEPIPIENFQDRRCTRCNGTGITETLGVSNLRSRAGTRAIASAAWFYGIRKLRLHRNTYQKNGSRDDHKPAAQRRVVRDQ